MKIGYQGILAEGSAREIPNTDCRVIRPMDDTYNKTQSRLLSTLLSNIKWFMNGLDIGGSRARFMIHRLAQSSRIAVKERDESRGDSFN